jgi:hypothetical protein
MTDKAYVKCLVQGRVESDDIISKALERNQNNVHLAAADLLFMLAVEMSSTEGIGVILRIAENYQEKGSTT